MVRNTEVFMAIIRAEVIGEGVDTHIDPRLLENTSTLVVDADRLAESLRAIEIPQMAIDSLTLNVKRSRSLDLKSVNVDYRLNKHEIDVSLAGKPTKLDGSIAGAWSAEPKSHSLKANYGLARTAHIIKEYTERHPDTVTDTSWDINKRIYGLLASTGVGATIGGTSTGRPSMAVVGGGVGMMADLVGLAASEFTPKRKEYFKALRLAGQRIDSRADSFAISREGFDLFNGIVEIEFPES